MNVTSSLSFPRDAGGYRKVAVTLSSGDLVRLVDDGKVEGFRLEPDGEDRIKIVNDDGERLSTENAFRILQAQADILLWWQVASEGGATAEYAREEIDACRRRAPLLR